jgi:hypothetical protein
VGVGDGVHSSGRCYWSWNRQADLVGVVMIFYALWLLVELPYFDPWYPEWGAWGLYVWRSEIGQALSAAGSCIAGYGPGRSHYWIPWR